MLKWVYARFDIPLSKLPVLLHGEPLDRLPDLFEDSSLVKQLQVNASDIPWWQESMDENAKVSQTTWRKSGNKSDWECTLSLCVEQDTEVVTVYLQYHEEPLSKPQDSETR
jgi:hypothetical protein